MVKKVKIIENKEPREFIKNIEGFLNSKVFKLININYSHFAEYSALIVYEEKEEYDLSDCGIIVDDDDVDKN